MNLINVINLTQRLELFLIAGVLGGLIGLERQFKKTDEHGALLGVRTFVFIALLGAASAMISQEHISWFLPVSFLGLVALIIVRYVIESKTGDIGITTEVTGMLTFLIGAMTYWQHLRLSIALAVVITLMLSLKPELQKMTMRVDTEDIRAIIKFAVISFIILPVFENRPIDPWGLFNPYEVWLMVVLISAVSFTGYIMLKFGRISGAMELTGLFGGIVSSTAVALSYSRRSKETPQMSRHLALGIILAGLVLFPRLLLLVGLMGRKLLGALVLPLGAMFTVGLALFLWHWLQYRFHGKTGEEVPFRNPFEISTAITFAAVYAAIRVLAALALKYYGQKGLYVTAVLSGVAETDAITLTVARMVQGVGAVAVSPRTGAIAVTLAVIMNTLFKGAIAFMIADPHTRRPVVRCFGIIVLVGIITMFFIR